MITIETVVNAHLPVFMSNVIDRSKPRSLRFFPRIDYLTFLFAVMAQNN
jgi:hypothetical protein